MITSNVLYKMSDYLDFVNILLNGDLYKQSYRQVPCGRTTDCVRPSVERLFVILLGNKKHILSILSISQLGDVAKSPFLVFGIRQTFFA